MDHSLQVARPKEVHGGVLGEGLVAHTVVPLGRLDALSRLGDDRHADISPPLGLIRLTPRHACGESVCGCSADSSGVPCCRFRPGISHTDPAGAILTTLPMTMVRRVRTAMLAPKAAAPAVGGGGGGAAEGGAADGAGGGVVEKVRDTRAATSAVEVAAAMGGGCSHGLSSSSDPARCCCPLDVSTSSYVNLIE